MKNLIALICLAVGLSTISVGCRASQVTSLATTVMESGPLVELCTRDLSRRISIDPAEIEVYSTENITFHDASLGCPIPDLTYEQVLTPGFIILLETQNTKYEYHTDTKDNIVLCKISKSIADSSANTTGSLAIPTATPPPTSTPKITDTTKTTPPPSR